MLLKTYEILAWDFDDTLIGHKSSPQFWDYIERNPYGQVHHIVTMRSHGWDRSIFGDLKKHGSALQRSHFGEIIAIPDAIYESYVKERANHSSAPLNHAYNVFKGEHCKRLGAEVLIDDMEEGSVSQRGCDLYGIIHIHPNDLTGL